MGAARSAGSLGLRQQFGVDEGDFDVVGQSCPAAALSGAIVDLNQPAQLRELIGPCGIEARGEKQLFDLTAGRSNDLSDNAGACAVLALPFPFLVKLQRAVI